MSQTNLLKETIETILDSGHNIDDIECIGLTNTNQVCSFEEFRILADDEYDPGFGRANVRQDLFITFRDGTWLERGEYDGAEWWEYKYQPKLGPFTSKMTSVFGNY